MAYAENGGVRIYYDVIGEGRPLMLLHGGLVDGSVWSHAGYVSALRADHLLLVVDRRGNGMSDRPRDPRAHLSEATLGDVLAVADAAGIDRFAMWGWSAGGWDAWLAAHAAPDRVVAIIVTGNPDPRSFKTPEEALKAWSQFHDEVLEPMHREGPSVAVRLLEENERGAIPDWMRTLIVAADLEGFNSKEVWLEKVITSLSDFPAPVLLIEGEYEEEVEDAVNVAESLPRGESFTVPSVGHVGAFVRSDLTLPRAREFLDRWFAWPAA